MFAEELEGNSSRKKQEDARARRRKLKLQQEQKKKAAERAKQQKEAAIATAINADGNGSAFSTPLATVPKSLPSTTAVSADVEFPTANTGGKSAAVANALQQRQERQQAQQQVNATMKIQSFYRAHRSNSNLLVDQANLLTKRLQDLNTLATILRQQANGNSQVYIPPPATATALCQQLIFLTKSLPYKSSQIRVVKLRRKLDDPILLQQIIRLVLLPGIGSHDENTNPLLVWIQTKSGQIRLEGVLRVLLVTITTLNVAQEVQMACHDFLAAVLGTSTDKTVPPKVVTFCAKELKLLSSAAPSPPTTQPTAQSLRTQPKPISILGSSLDLVSLLRFHLLYTIGGNEPIPKGAEQSREDCISSLHKKHADALFSVVLGATMKSETFDNQRQLYLRIVSDLLAIPLLTWKVKDSLDLLLSKKVDGSKERIFLIVLLDNFAHHYGEQLTVGQIGATLRSDTSLIICPATNTQCLLANLLQIGRLSPHLNGYQQSKLDFADAAIFYKFLSTLLDAIPLATLTSRESVVEWISDGKGHLSPVVLSPTVMEQCKYLLSDAFVRRIFSCAIDSDALQVENILNQKDDYDKKQEAELHEAGASATSLAAKEARVDRSKGFWQSSGWAKKLGKGMSKIMSGDKKKSRTGMASTNLIDASAVSRQLAQGERSAAAAESPSKKTEARVAYTNDLLLSLCRVYGIILARWGGGGGEDIIGTSGRLYRKDLSGTRQEIATSTPDISTQSLLNTLIFSTSLIRTSWALVQCDQSIMSDVNSIIDPHKGKAPVRSTSIRPVFGGTKGQTSHDGAAVLFMFVSALSHILIVTDDTEIHELSKPLPLHQVRRCIRKLKQLLYRTCCLDEKSITPEGDETGLSSKQFATSYFGLALIHASSKALRDLYDRSSRRPLAVPKLWLVDDLLEKEIRRCKTEEDYVKLLSSPVLRVCPYLVSFKRRLRLFDRIVSTNRVSIQGENSQNPFHTNPLKPGIPVRITRGRILEDGLATMNNLGRDMRQRLSVQYYNEAGTRESGIDAGGLFKEFWTDLCAIAFDPNYALFKVTEENCMYPNPSSGAAHGSDHIMLFEFLGRILGKALYEGITVHPQFAHFFLSHLRGDYNYLHMLADLSTMDSQLYNNIMFLKTYDGDAEDLCLSFTVANDDFGTNREIPLMPNGVNIEVTNSNKQRYIGLVAKYYVVDRIKDQSEALTRGLREVIDKAWLKIFNEPELQILISGASDGKIDVEDMRANCRYAGGFTGLDRSVNRFWNAVASMDSKQQASLLRFVTSCERPPPLGFSSLTPPFTIQRVGIMRDGDKLPTSSTCFNVLKLPTYSSEKVMKERLIYAIESGAGFELS